MDLSWLNNFSSELVRGAGLTVQLLLFSAGFGFLLAIAVALGRLSNNLVLSNAARFFSSVIRGTPLLVQIYILYYGVGSVLAGFPLIRGGVLWPYLREGFWYVALALTLSVGAYVGEVLRSGLRAVPKGELEAARAYGMRRGQILRRVWLPRALQMVRPTLAGESVMLLKSTALASTVAVTDLLGAANIVRSQTLRVYEPLLLVAVTYIVLALIIEKSFKLMGNTASQRRVH